MDRIARFPQRWSVSWTINCIQGTIRWPFILARNLWISDLSLELWMLRKSVYPDFLVLGYVWTVWTDAIRIGNGIRVYWYLWFCVFFLWIWKSQWNLDTQINDYHDSYPQDGWLSTSISCWKRIWYVLLLLLMEAILHRLIDSSSHYLQGFFHQQYDFWGIPS